MDEQQVAAFRIGFGQRLAAARVLKGLTQDQVGEHFDTNKGTVSAWEKGRADPSSFKLAVLCKLYGVSADSLLWENSLSKDAMKIAAEYDSLSVRQQATLRTVWDALVTKAVSDQLVEEKMPITAELKASEKA